MNSAYDVKDLAAKLKGRGLDIAEEAGKVVVEEVFNWLSESAAVSPSPHDNLLALIYPEAKKIALSAVDKIDGQVG